MPSWLTQTFPGDADLSVSAILLRLVAAIVLGGAVATVYRETRRERSAGPDLSQTLLLLTLVIAMITLAVGGNVARAFSLVGALAIVRFRMAVNDPRDTAFVILAVAVGLATGAGFLAVPAIGIPLAAAVAVAFAGGRRPQPTSCTIALTIEPDGDTAAHEPVLATFVEDLHLRRIETRAKSGGTEVTYHGHLKPGREARDLADRLGRLAGIAAVDLRFGDAARS